MNPKTLPFVMLLYIYYYQKKIYLTLILKLVHLYMLQDILLRIVIQGHHEMSYCQMFLNTLLVKVVALIIFHLVS